MKLDEFIEGNEKKSIVQEPKPFHKSYIFSFLIFPVIDFSGDYLISDSIWNNLM